MKTGVSIENKGHRLVIYVSAAATRAGALRVVSRKVRAVVERLCGLGENFDVFFGMEIGGDAGIRSYSAEINIIALGDGQMARLAKTARHA